MSGVILQILSGIGILLLIILCIILLLILLVLFVPVRYTVKGRRNDGEPELFLKVGWLLGVVRGSFSYPQPGKLRFYVLCKELKPKETSDVQNPSGAHNKKKSVTSGEQKEGDDRSTKADTGDISLEQNKNPEVKKEKEPTEPSEDQNPEKSSDKLKSGYRNIRHFVELLQDGDTKLLLGQCKLRLLKVLKSIRPRTVKADILFGTGQPDTTGYLYGVTCMVSPCLGRDLIITPDFQNAVLEGNFYIKGHISVVVLLTNAILILTDKKLRILFKKMKNGRKK